MLMGGSSADYLIIKQKTNHSQTGLSAVRSEYSTCRRIMAASLEC